MLGVVEVFTLDFIFIMLAAGAAGGLDRRGDRRSVVAVRHRRRASVALVLLVPRASARCCTALGRDADPHRTGVEGLVGMAGTVAVAFTSSRPGQVRLANGETWSARIDTAVPDRTPPLGTPVVVESIEGSTAVVRPSNRRPPP